MSGQGSRAGLLRLARVQLTSFPRPLCTHRRKKRSGTFRARLSTHIPAPLREQWEPLQGLYSRFAESSAAVAAANSTSTQNASMVNKARGGRSGATQSNNSGMERAQSAFALQKNGTRNGASADKYGRSATANGKQQKTKVMTLRSVLRIFRYCKICPRLISQSEVTEVRQRLNDR